MTWFYVVAFLAFGWVSFWLGVAVGRHGSIIREVQNACPFKTDEGAAKMMMKLRARWAGRTLH
jgi:hypothetical protein